MKLRLQKDQAKKTIAYILSIVNEPVILLSCHQDKQAAGFEGASSGVYVRVRFPAAVEATGIVAIDGSQLAGLKLPTDVVLSADKSNLYFQSGTFQGNINTLASGAHVTMQRPQGNLDAYSWVKIPKDTMLRAMTATVFETSLKSSVNGATLRIENGTLIMYTFDAVRASLYVAPIDSDATVRAVLSNNFYHAIKKIPGDNLEMSFDSGSVLVRTDSSVLSYPTLQTDTQDVYDDVSLLMQTPRHGLFSLSSKRLADAVSTAASVVRGGLSYDTRVHVNVSDSVLTIKLVSEYGQVSESVPIEGTVEPCSFDVSGKHMSEMISLLTGDVQVQYYGSTVMFIGDEGRATVVVSTLS